MSRPLADPVGWTSYSNLGEGWLDGDQMVKGVATARRVAVEAVGWVLVIGGIGGLILPGPGLLMIFAGMAILSQQYEWAERRLEPVKQRALGAAKDSVETWPRILGSTAGGLMVLGFGVLWLVQPPPPTWWPLRDSWWLFGGFGAGLTLALSGLIALALVVYSYRRFRRPAGAAGPSQPGDSPESPRPA